MWRILGYTTKKSSKNFFSVFKKTEKEALMLKDEMEIKYPFSQFIVFKYPQKISNNMFHVEQ